MRARPILGLVVAALACKGPAPTTGPMPQGVPATVPGHDAYADFAFPPTDRPWAVADYEMLRDTLVAIEQRAPDLLLRADGPKADVFARLASYDDVTRAIRESTDIEQMIAIGDAVAAIYKLYTARVLGGASYGREYVALSTTYLHVAALQFAGVTEQLGLTVERLRKDDVRLNGFAKMRHATRITLTGLLTSSLERPEIVVASDVAERLRPVLSEITPLLLPEERSAIRELVAKLEDVGAAPETIAALERELDPTRPHHELVTAFLAEHRTFSTEQDARIQQTLDSAITPIVLGEELGGVRFALPDRSISAVFDVQPTASETTTREADAVTTMRMLASADATGFTRSAVCISRQPSKLETGFAKDVLTKMGAQGIRPVSISGHDGFEGSIEQGPSRALVRAVRIGEQGCIIVVEYPPRIAATAKPRARAFVDSVELAQPTSSR